MNPGNPVQSYMKCFMEQQKFFFDKASFERREKLLAIPLKELPAQDVLDSGDLPLSQADWGARLDTPDWQVLLKVKTDGVALLVPDLSELRSLAKPLKLRFRAEVACGRFDQAIRTAKTMFAMARHLGEHPTLIGMLVGISMASNALDPLEEMLEQPGSPNLYWALTTLPTPLVSPEKAVRGERVWITVEFRDLDEIAPMSADQLDRFSAHVDKLLGAEKPFAPGQGIRGAVEQRIKVEGNLGAARRRLIDFGFTEDRLLHFPPAQIILLDEKREYEVRRDDILKLMSLPMSQAATLASQTKPAAERGLFANRLLEGLMAAFWRQWNLDQRIVPATARRSSLRIVCRHAQRCSSRKTLRCTGTASRRPELRPTVPVRTVRRNGPHPRRRAWRKRQRPSGPDPPCGDDPEVRNQRRRDSILDACQTFFYNCRRSSISLGAAGSGGC